MIEVRLFATFREGREKIIFMKSSEISTVSDIINQLEIDEEDMAICLINGFHSKAIDTVKAGDIISLFPPVGGG